VLVFVFLGLAVLLAASMSGVVRSKGWMRESAGGVMVVALPEATNVTSGKYVLRAGGPRNFVPVTNSPASNRAIISVIRNEGGKVVLLLTNGEPHSILLWNVRVQTRSSGAGTDGFGWDTVADDYPNATRAALPPGTAGEFLVEAPDGTPWRPIAGNSTPAIMRFAAGKSAVKPSEGADRPVQLRSGCSVFV
jgi:hypothetical protein